MSELKKPCQNCPMRIDQVKAEWTEEQLKNILVCENENWQSEDFESGKVLHQMACHKSKIGKETHCIGWVISQLKYGVSNIGLRISLSTGRVDKQDYDLSFEVHQSISKAFENKVIKPYENS